jgi:CPA2 family monovalent cation:H+ antiporter-2
VLAQSTRVFGLGSEKRELHVFVMREADLVLTLTGALGAALVFGFATRRIGLSPIVGYLIAGVVVGPFTPGIVLHAGLAEELAEIGVVLLMFGVGLHFRVEDLLAVRRVALPGAIVQSAVATGLGVLIARAAGWSLGAGLVLGVAISVASTVVMVRVLADNDALETPGGRVAVGWLVTEDLFTVLVLVMMPAFAGARAGGAIALVAVTAILKVAALVAFTWFVGRRLIPAFLRWIERTRSRELFTLAVLVIALGIAASASRVFGASLALGAFLAGMVVGQSEFASRAANDALPMRDAFAVLFFVSIGMLLDPAELAPNAALVAALVLVIVVAKPLAAYVIVRVLRQPEPVARVVAGALCQIGEFSFILAALARDLGVLPPRAMHALVAAAIASITVSPILFRVLNLPRSRAAHAAR